MADTDDKPRHFSGEQLAAIRAAKEFFSLHNACPTGMDEVLERIACAPSAVVGGMQPLCEHHRNGELEIPDAQPDDLCVACRISYLEAQEGLLEEWQQRAIGAEEALAEVQRPLDAQMARLNATVTRLNEENERLRSIQSHEQRGEPARVDQSVIGAAGNCQSACLAMLLGIDLCDVPNFLDLPGADVDDEVSFKAQQAWLNARGWGLVTIQARGPFFKRHFAKGYVLVGGKSPRGLPHAVIYKDGELWHDPHPSREGVAEIEEVDILYPLVPCARSATRRTTGVLPDCMMPDGAEPCAGYRQLERLFADVAVRSAERTYDGKAFEEGRDTMADDILDILGRYEREGQLENWLIKEIRKACNDQLTSPKPPPVAIVDRPEAGPLIPASETKPTGEALLLTTSKVWIIGDWYQGAWRTHRSWWEPGDVDGTPSLRSAFAEGDITHWVPLPSTAMNVETQR